MGGVKEIALEAFEPLQISPSELQSSYEALKSRDAEWTLTELGLSPPQAGDADGGAAGAAALFTHLVVALQRLKETTPVPDLRPGLIAGVVETLDGPDGAPRLKLHLKLRSKEKDLTKGSAALVQEVLVSLHKLPEASLTKAGLGRARALADHMDLSPADVDAAAARAAVLRALREVAFHRGCIARLRAAVRGGAAGEDAWEAVEEHEAALGRQQLALGAATTKLKEELKRRRDAEGQQPRGEAGAAAGGGADGGSRRRRDEERRREERERWRREQEERRPWDERERARVYQQRAEAKAEGRRAVEEAQRQREEERERAWRRRPREGEDEEEARREEGNRARVDAARGRRAPDEPSRSQPQGPSAAAAAAAAAGAAAASVEADRWVTMKLDGSDMRFDLLGLVLGPPEGEAVLREALVAGDADMIIQRATSFKATHADYVAAARKAAAAEPAAAAVAAAVAAAAGGAPAAAEQRAAAGGAPMASPFDQKQPQGQQQQPPQQQQQQPGDGGAGVRGDLSAFVGNKRDPRLASRRLATQASLGPELSAQGSELAAAAAAAAAALGAQGQTPPVAAAGQGAAQLNGTYHQQPLQHPYHPQQQSFFSQPQGWVPQSWSGAWTPAPTGVAPALQPYSQQQQQQQQQQHPHYHQQSPVGPPGLGLQGQGSLTPQPSLVPTPGTGAPGQGPLKCPLCEEFKQTQVWQGVVKFYLPKPGEPLDCLPKYWGDLVSARVCGHLFHPPALVGGANAKYWERYRCLPREVFLGQEMPEGVAQGFWRGCYPHGCPLRPGGILDPSVPCKEPRLWDCGVMVMAPADASAAALMGRLRAVLCTQGLYLHSKGFKVGGPHSQAPNLMAKIYVLPGPDNWLFREYFSAAVPQALRDAAWGSGREALVMSFSWFQRQPDGSNAGWEIWDNPCWPWLQQPAGVNSGGGAAAGIGQAPAAPHAVGSAGGPGQAQLQTPQHRPPGQQHPEEQQQRQPHQPSQQPSQQPQQPHQPQQPQQPQQQQPQPQQPQPQQPKPQDRRSAFPSTMYDILPLLSCPPGTQVLSWRSLEAPLAAAGAAAAEGMRLGGVAQLPAAVRTGAPGYKQLLEEALARQQQKE